MTERSNAEQGMSSASITIYDHYSDQRHENVEAFFEAWEVEKRGSPWDEMNVPVGLNVYEDDSGQLQADILVLLPRKSHVKHLYIKIETHEELRRLRGTFSTIGLLYDAAKETLQRFANGEEAGLYYWEEPEILST